MILHFSQVTFVGEEGADIGGPTREFFRLCKLNMSKYLNETGCFIHDAVSFQV